MEDQDLLMMMLMKPQTLITQTSMPIITPTSTSTSTTTTTTTTSSSSYSLAMHKSSHTISKPKIRIIHIFAPEIIKTDAANFRELVQRLTGKPAANGKIKKTRRSRHHQDEAVEKVEIMNNINVNIRSSATTVKEEESNDFQMWSSSNNNNSLFGGGFLGDFEGFNAQEFGDFSFLPHTNMHAFDRDPHLIT